MIVYVASLDCENHGTEVFASTSEKKLYEQIAEFIDIDDPDKIDEYFEKNELDTMYIRSFVIVAQSAPIYACQNCSWEGPGELLGDIKDYHERVEPGEPEPDGECPDCGALCHARGGH